MTAPSAEGIVVVDKPAGWTSHDVVARVRRLAGTRRVGHAGTLDPMATGVLVVGVGRATRLLGHLALHDKDYLATIQLGVVTTTDDADGDVVSTTDATAVTEDAVESAMSALVGDIEQVPSSVSAVKVDGERAYKLARRGADVQLEPRRVHVARFELTARRGDALDVVVSCSTGTYVRALARDLGGALGVGAHLTALRRTRVGAFTQDEARTLDALEAGFAVTPLADAVARSFPRLDVDEADARRLMFGQRVSFEGDDPGTVGVFAPSGDVVAIAERREGRLRTLVVFTSASDGSGAP